MLRMSRLTDYGTVVLSYMAHHEEGLHSAADVAANTRLAPPTVAKLLKAFARVGIVTSARGPQGGYTLARRPSEISAAEIIDALEGPLALTECSASEHSCELESICRVGGAWQQINLAIRDALREVSLSQLMTVGRTKVSPIDLQVALSASGGIKN
ncbi:MAG: SUF system Fe-S cluster assembly regulator [Gammaproteobacteria bacterium]